MTYDRCEKYDTATASLSIFADILSKCRTQKLTMGSIAPSLELSPNSGQETNDHSHLYAL